MVVKRGEGDNLADVGVGAERFVDGGDGEGEWKGKLAIPGLWDEGFEELEGRGGMGGIRQEHHYETKLPKPTTSLSSPAIRHNQHLPHRLLLYSPTLSLYHIAPPPTPFQTASLHSSLHCPSTEKMSQCGKALPPGIQLWQILGRWSNGMNAQPD